MRLRPAPGREPLFTQNALDRVISWISPERGRDRLQARAQIAMANKYSGADRGRRWRLGWNVPSGDADTDTLPDLPNMRDDSSDLLRDNTVANSVINTKTTAVVGTGLQLRSQIDREILGLSDEQADEWESRTESEWRLFSGHECDLHRSMNFAAIMALLFRASLERGDALLTTPTLERPPSPYSLRLQVVEADRVSNPDKAQDTEKITAGVEKDQHGAPAFYHVLRGHPGNRNTDQDHWDKVPVFGATGRRRAFLFFHKKRPGQTRGVPDLATVVQEIKQISRYTKAEIEKAVVQALFTVFIKTDGGYGLAPPLIDGQVQDATSAHGDKQDIRMGAGNIVDLNPGEDPVFANPTAPNPNSEAFLQAMLMQIGMAVEVPYEVLAKRFQSSYSASKAAMLELWRFVAVHRKRLADDICRPVYELFMDEAVARGRIYAPGYLDGDPLIRAAWLGSEWVGPARGDMNELQQVNAAVKRVEAGFSSRARETVALTGGDWEHEHRQQAKEHRKRLADGLEQTAPAQQQQGEIEL
jgi:lambda family phage portal protein